MINKLTKRESVTLLQAYRALERLDDSRKVPLTFSDGICDRQIREGRRVIFDTLNTLSIQNEDAHAEAAIEEILN